ncbi:precorrin-3B C(17)-methyltransferase [Catenulispora pinisilvae]|uniref:precorrin-3B C(17)-methyltransferase n=1 Tax=Catenulispora pinisilvae TaxID=2705253 RepID=UPI001E5451CD|nr:precorrin-3B C(17)-methyltransferase [Catenulispora pinisilvae]
MTTTTHKTIGVVAATSAGHHAAATLAAAWPTEVRLYAGAADLRTAFESCDAVVAFLAIGATVRSLAPLLGHKSTDAPVVCIDESLRHAIALLGGHHGANTLAERVSELLGCTPVITTASDTAGTQALDSYGADLGFTIENPDQLAPIGTALLSGAPVALRGTDSWPLPVLNAAGGEAQAVIAVSDLVDAGGSIATDDDSGTRAETLVYRPPSLVVGVGASRGVSAEEVLDAVDRALAGGGMSPASVARLASVDAKADEVGILEAARRRGWQVVFHPAEVLAKVQVPNPSEVVLAEVGTPSVAEAAARYDGPNRPLAELIVSKTKSVPAGIEPPAGMATATPAGLAAEPVRPSLAPMATAAVARLAPRGRLALIGLGPGARDLLPPRAVAELRRASVVIGLDQYLDQIRDLLRPGTEVRATGLGSEEARARDAVRTAREGRAVALVGSGDSGLYAMASPALDLFADLDDVDVVGVPGITASLAASNILGAPLGHDHAVISLSDLHTPWPAIERRVKAAAEGDFVTVFYNPRSKGRDWQLGHVLGILKQHRPPTTPVGCVRDASRPGERAWISTLSEFDPADVDMYTIVLVGSTHTRVAAGRMVTPRGYTWSAE